MKSGLNSPLASSCGRLFDAVAAALDISREPVQYEGQAAMELEAIVESDELKVTKGYSFESGKSQLDSAICCIDPASFWVSLLNDLKDETPSGIIAARFHKGLARAITDMVRKLNGGNQFEQVALSGGVFQNKILLELVIEMLESSNFQVLTHSKIPANDGGIALGQAVVAAAKLSCSGGAIPCV